MVQTSHDPNAGKSGQLSVADVIRLTGDLDDETVVAVIATGATAADIEQAVKWAGGDAEALGKSGYSLTGVPAAVFDILTTCPAFVPSGRER